MTISYNFHISRPNTIYLNLNWDHFLLAWKFGPSWGRFHAADRHIEMPLTKCFAVFFWGGILFFQRQRSTVSKKSLRCFFCFRKSGLCTIFFGVICDHLSASSPSSLVWWGYAIVGLSTALVLELVSLYFSHWEFIDFHAIGGSAWWVVWKPNQGYFFCFWKGQFRNWIKKECSDISWHSFRHFICNMLNSFVIFIVTNIHQANSHRRVCQYRKSLWKTILEYGKTCRLDQNQYEIDPNRLFKTYLNISGWFYFWKNQDLPLENRVN